MESHALSRSLDQAAPLPCIPPKPHTRRREHSPQEKGKALQKKRHRRKSTTLPTHTATAHPLIRPTASLRRNASTKRHFLIKPGEYTQQRDFPDCFAAYMAMSLCRTKSSSFVPGSSRTSRAGNPKPETPPTDFAKADWPSLPKTLKTAHQQGRSRTHHRRAVR